MSRRSASKWHWKPQTDLGDAEGLVAAGGAGEQRDGALGQVEGVVVPLHRRHLGRRAGEQRVGGGLGRRGQRDDAELRGGAEMDLGAPGAGQELAAEADAEHGPAGGGVGAGEVEQGGEVAAAVVVVGVHRTAQDQEAVMVGGVGGEVDAGLRVQGGHPGRARRHPLADQAGGRGRVVLEDQDARPHRPPAPVSLILVAGRRISRPWPSTPPSPTPPASSRRSSRCSRTGATRSSTSSSSARTCRRCRSALKTEGNKVRGCQSQVWLVAEPEAGGGRIHLRAPIRTPESR